MLTVLLCLLQANSTGFQDFKIYKNPVLDHPSFYSWGYEVIERKGLAKATQQVGRRVGTRSRALRMRAEDAGAQSGMLFLRCGELFLD